MTRDVSTHPTPGQGVVVARGPAAWAAVLGMIALLGLGVLVAIPLVLLAILLVMARVVLGLLASLLPGRGEARGGGGVPAHDREGRANVRVVRPTDAAADARGPESD